MSTIREMTKMQSIYGVGNPLMDVMLSGDHGLLESLNVAAGSMNLVDSDVQEDLIRKCMLVSRSPGGSCANTLRAVAWLNEHGPWDVSVSYTGAVGTDDEGDRFESILRDEKVIPLLARKKSPTGRSVIVVTPDSERTMFTHLGACRELVDGEIASERIADFAAFHTTGYMWDTANQETAAKAAIRRARSEGVTVSFDIADPFVVHRYASTLGEWLPGNIDVLFANREELAALVGVDGSAEQIVEAAGHFAPLVIMKVGKDGCYLCRGGAVVHVQGNAARATDTTGAGDVFAGGFLYAYVSGLFPEECARIANRVAAAVVEVSGCSFSQLDGELVMKDLV